MRENKVTGSIGERIATEYLQKKGYHIIECNAYSRWGEIDIVAEKQNIIIFIEVKTRKSLKQGKPYEAVSYQKNPTPHENNSILHKIQRFGKKKISDRCHFDSFTSRQLIVRTQAF